MYSNSSYEHSIIIEQGDTSKKNYEKRYSLQKIILSRERKPEKNESWRKRQEIVLNRDTK